MKNALLSLFDKTDSEKFAGELVDLGFTLYGSKGTTKHLKGYGLPITDIAEITGCGPILDHRVVTLDHKIHAGLLASPEMLPELDQLGIPPIDLLRVDFYPLQAELDNPDATLESCIASTDIGGPAMIRSANKGGRTIPITSREYERHVIKWLQNGRQNEERFMYNLRMIAELEVSRYTQLSYQVYTRFSGLFPKD